MIAAPPGFWRLVRPHRSLLAIAFAAMVVESAASLWEPWPIKLIVDHVIGGAPLPPSIARWALFGLHPLGIMNAAALAVMAIAAIGAAGAYTQKSLATTVGQRVMHDLRGTLYHHLQQQPLPFFDSRRTGDLMVRLDERRGRHAGVLLVGAAERDHGRADARGHGRDHAVSRLALRAAGARGGAAAVSRGVSPHAAHQAGGPRGQAARERPGVGGAGVVVGHPDRADASHARTTKKRGSIARAAPPCTPRSRRAA